LKVFYYSYTVFQKGDTEFVAVTLSNLNQFLKFFH